ncbi:hypothetical protein KIL84_014778 [Mauremys mutica]|uniref:Uncharacterized protein n=1 Tax=Mauremys mutica TaxID=74926 RepID=A0A9D3XQB8_9SAUR|nr:hypothetical protein KIL84_014778 [Mauremys mutica]
MGSCIIGTLVEASSKPHCDTSSTQLPPGRGPKPVAEPKAPPELDTWVRGQSSTSPLPLPRIEQFTQGKAGRAARTGTAGSFPGPPLGVSVSGPVASSVLVINATEHQRACSR